MSKRHYGVLLLTACLSLTGINAQAEENAACDKWVAKVASVQGEVEAKPDKATGWSAVQREQTLCPGDQVRVGKKSRASIVFINETIVRLDQYSALTITKIEEDDWSLIDLVKGIAHFISRVPRSLKVKTPFVNAAIEGTEFVVEVNDNDTTVTVFEGTVLTQNDQGETRITDNEVSRAVKGQAPQKILIAKPRDAVQWALYFPPIIKGDANGNAAQKASQLLYVGRVAEARASIGAAMQETIGAAKAETVAISAIIAVVENDKDTAFKLANEAVSLNPDSAAAHMALSYAWQSKLDLSQALNSANTATQKEPNNAIAWARLAELQLSTGQLNDALVSATKANELDGSIARSRTILGYAYLTRINTGKARQVFNEAIALDQVDPLPRLGLGLAKIRVNELAEGRREIEIAASLDPNNAIIRSYLGKAYYEEKRGPLDAEQFAMARELDPNDPTPYFYDAIRKQSENDPVGALQDLNKSIELNDNRAVYRSSLQLDQDEAARSVSQARIYKELGLDNIAINRTSMALSSTPDNSSAHLSLSNSYALKPSNEIARVSELFQHLLLRPLSSAPVHASQSSTIGSSIGVNDLNASLNEYTDLFTRESINYYFSGLIGKYGTVGNQQTISGLKDKLAYSISQYNYNTDGYRSTDYADHDIFNYFTQYGITNNLHLQFEHTNRTTSIGNNELKFGTTISSSNNFLQNKIYRLGLRYNPTANSTLLASHIHTDRDTSKLTPGTLTSENIAYDDADDTQIQYIHNFGSFNLISGLGYNTINGTGREILTLFGSVVSDTPQFFDDNSENAYIYSNIQITPDLIATIGGSFESVDNVEPYRKEDVVNHKFGLVWNIFDELTIRLASFALMKRDLINEKTLEPTTIAGFNQFYDDHNATLVDASGAAIDYRATDFYAALELFQRNTRRPTTVGSNFQYISGNEDFATANLAYNFGNNLSVSLSHQYEKYRNDFSAPELLTNRITPFEIRYRNTNGFFSTLKYTNVVQKVGYATDPGFDKRDENFGVLDFGLGYKFPKQMGVFLIETRNLNNSHFEYQSLHYLRSFNFDGYSRFIPERNIEARFQLNF